LGSVLLASSAQHDWRIAAAFERPILRDDDVLCMTRKTTDRLIAWPYPTECHRWQQPYIVDFIRCCEQRPDGRDHRWLAPVA
jgi:hypothetical protein